MRGMNRIRSAMRRAIGCASLEDYSQERRAAMWPPATALEDKHVRNCRVVVNRWHALAHMPKNAVCAEVGVWKGDFAAAILEVTTPAKLHLIDFDPEVIRIAGERFSTQVKEGVVELRQGDSVATLRAFADGYFDWVYIDADHRYEGVKRDLEAVRPKLKPGGLIAMNDYIYFSPIDFAKYGVVEAVHEFCVRYDYEIIYLALNPRTYNDVVLRPLG